jgi:hypothetical protein
MLSKSLIVSMWAHSSWPRACSQPLSVLAVVFSLLNFYSTTIYWAINELVCELVSTQLMALSLLTTTAGTGPSFLLVKFHFFNWTLSYQRAWLWACELAAHGPGLVRSHCRYRQWNFWTLINLFYLNSKLSICLYVSLYVHSSGPWACLQPLLVPAVVFWL